MQSPVLHRTCECYGEVAESVEVHHEHAVQRIGVPGKVHGSSRLSSKFRGPPLTTVDFSEKKSTSPLWTPYNKLVGLKFMTSCTDEKDSVYSLFRYILD